MKRLRSKCWVDALRDGTLDKMKMDKVRKLIGFIEPFIEDKKTIWMVTMIDEGGFYDCKTQTEAEILSTSQQILFKLRKDV